MSSYPTRLTILAAATALAVTALTGCEQQAAAPGGETSGQSVDASSAKIAFLMPDLASTRYEQQDRPLFEAKMKELCPGCTVIYQNGDSDASKQQQQANSALAQGATVLVLDAVDTAGAASIVRTAQSQGVKVLSYDRPIPDVPADFYVSFDNEKIGASIAQSLVDDLKASNASGGILQINGSPTDAAAGLIKKGVHSVVDDSGFELLAEFDTPEWQPAKAQDWTSGQITRFGDKIVGVVAANDGTGGGAISAFKAAGGDVPPITGNDAEVAAIQRIVAGDQYNTITKRIKTVAEAAAEAAWLLAQGQAPQEQAKLFNTPSQLFEPTVVTQENLKEVIIDGGIYPASQICTGAYKAGCDELGIS